MRKIIFIATKDFWYTLQDKTVLVWLFIMPLVFFGFIGYSTQGFGGSANQKFSLAVWYQGDQQDPIFQQLKHRLEQENFALRLFNEQQTKYQDKWSFDDYKRKLWLPEQPAKTVQAQQQAELQYRFKGDGLNNELLEFRLHKAVYQTLGDLLVLQTKHRQQARRLDFDQLNQRDSLLELSIQQAGKQQSIPSGFKQAVPGILVMFVMMIVLTNGAESLFLERQSGVLRRLSAAPLSKGQLIWGKWLGKLLLAICQLIYGMLIGSLLFKVHWGENLPTIFILLLAWAAACTGFAVWFGGVAKNQGQINSLPIIFSLLLAALGGCWWPIEVTPEWMQQLAMYLPTGWVMDALHKLMYFGGSFNDVVNHQIALYLLALFALLLVFKTFKPEIKKTNK